MGALVEQQRAVFFEGSDHWSRTQHVPYQNFPQNVCCQEIMYRINEIYYETNGNCFHGNSPSNQGTLCSTCYCSAVLQRKLRGEIQPCLVVAFGASDMTGRYCGSATETVAMATFKSKQKC